MRVVQLGLNYSACSEPRLPTANLSLARQRFDDALRFSTVPNEIVSAFSVLLQLTPGQAGQLMRLIRTFMLLITVGAFDAFTTERCQELGLCPLSRGKPVSPDRAFFREKLCTLRPISVPADAWAAQVENAYELYYKARTLWIHGAGIPGAVRDGSRDLSVFDQDSEGRCWVSERLWSGCVKALGGLADDCR